LDGQDKDVRLTIGLPGQTPVVDLHNPPSGSVTSGYAPVEFTQSLLVHAKIGDTIHLAVDVFGFTDFAFHDARTNGPGMVEARLNVAPRGTVTGSDLGVTELNWDPATQVVDYAYAVFGGGLAREVNVGLYWGDEGGAILGGPIVEKTAQAAGNYGPY